MVLVFSNSETDASLQEQRRLFAKQESAFSERDLLVFYFSGDDQQSTELRKRYHVAPGSFAVVLIGKDGGEKMTKAKPATPDSLFALIDTMPMRQAEMKRQ